MIRRLVQEIFDDDHRFIRAVFWFSLALRLIFLFFIQNKFYFSDSLEYEDAALNILAGKGFGDFPREPLYPVWIALVYLFAGARNILALRVVEAVLGALLSVVIFLLGRDLFGSVEGKIAALTASIYPLFVFLPALNYPTLLATLFITGGVYLVQAAVKRDRNWIGIAGGVLFGLSALAIAPTAVLLPALLFWILFVSAKSVSRKLILCSLITLSFCLTLTPWMVRSYLYHEKFVPIRQMQEMDRRFLDFHLGAAGSEEPAGEPEWMVAAARVGRAFLRFWAFMPQSEDMMSANPEYNQRVAEQDERITRRNFFSTSRLSYLVVGASFAPLLILAVVGLVPFNGSVRERLLLLILIVSLAGIYSLFYPKVRYRIPIEPLLMILAAHGIRGFASLVHWSLPRARQSNVSG